MILTVYVLHIYYHRFPNLVGLIQIYFVSKLWNGFSSKYFVNIYCNCNWKTKLNDICTYKDKYRKCCILIKSQANVVTTYLLEIIKINKKKWNNTSKICPKRYCTIKLDSFAAHFAKCLDKNQTHNIFVKFISFINNCGQPYWFD